MTSYTKMRVLGLTPSAIGLPLVTATKKTGEREGLVAYLQDEKGGSYCKLSQRKGRELLQAIATKREGVIASYRD